MARIGGIDFGGATVQSFQGQPNSSHVAIPQRPRQLHKRIDRRVYALSLFIFRIGATYAGLIYRDLSPGVGRAEVNFPEFIGAKHCQ